MINTLVRIIVYSLLVFLGFSGPLWAFVLVAAGYTFVFTGIEIIFVGFMIDAYYIYGRPDLPLYTIGLMIGLLLVQVMRPYISMYNR